ncbi:MAG: DUF5930 domain-containing protein [Rhodobacteraceae bacterium]|nr:DUF5930 domain-containing protein [Paracoccaceae bacterium]
MQITPPGRGLAHFLPNQTITMTDSHGIRSFTLSPVKRLVFGSAVFALIIWAVLATVTLLIYSIGEDKMRQRSAVLTLAYETRLNDLQAERDSLSGQLANVSARMLTAQSQLMNQQQNILQLGSEQQNLDANIANLRDQLGKMLSDRDIAVEASTNLGVELASLRELMTSRLGGQSDVLTTIEALTGALAGAVETRDMVQADIFALNEQIDAMELQRELTNQRQDRMLTQLEDAIEVSLVPLSTLFDAVGMDVDGILANVRQNYSGTGGISDEEVTGEIDPTDVRINQLLQGLDQVASLNMAASKLPLAMPLRTSFRYTSGFGPRGGRIHKGIDMAGARDSPILATGDGVVSFSGVQSGFGNLVIINHENGYQTYYAHMARTRVSVGTVVARGDRIGDMGNSGRSSGVHLHYEIRTDGVSINPMTFIKAGRNVY